MPNLNDIGYEGVTFNGILRSRELDASVFNNITLFTVSRRSAPSFFEWLPDKLAEAYITIRLKSDLQVK